MFRRQLGGRRRVKCGVACGPERGSRNTIRAVVRYWGRCRCRCRRSFVCLGVWTFFGYNVMQSIPFLIRPFPSQIEKVGQRIRWSILSLAVSRL